MYIIRGFLSTPLKKRPNMLSEGNAALTVGYNSPLQIVKANVTTRYRETVVRKSRYS
jgi:hypothetical protein